MARRRTQLTVLCEDPQHESFARRFLQRRGWRNHQIRMVKAPPGRGAAERFVRSQFPQELQAVRRSSVDRALVVVIDGDAGGYDQRETQLTEACDVAGVDRRRPGDPVAVVVPTWNIETWLAYLDGDEVDERRSNYPKLDRERECQRHVDVLVGMCEDQLREPAPPSLKRACEEFRPMVGRHR